MANAPLILRLEIQAKDFICIQSGTQFFLAIYNVAYHGDPINVGDVLMLTHRALDPVIVRITQVNTDLDSGFLAKNMTLLSFKELK